MSNKTGMSLHIGVNLLDPAGYLLDPPDDRWPNGWDGELKGCHFDAEAMCEIAKTQNFETKLLLSEQATADNVKAEVRRIAGMLSEGDTFFLSFAGHGGQVPDISGDESIDEWDDDGWDETWCLHDRHFIDDEQQIMYADFAPGVRIIILSDSCHSGTVTRGPNESDTESNIRTMPRKTAHACYAARKPEYDDLQRGLKKVSPDDVKASILLISACQENEVAGDGDANGKFTSAVLKVWDKGGFQGNYEKFHKEITQKLEESYEVDKAAHARGETKKKAIFQTPNFDTGNIENDAFRKGAPFSI